MPDNNTERTFATEEEAVDFCDARISESDETWVTAYVNDGSLEGGHWIAELIEDTENEDEEEDPDEVFCRSLTQDLFGD